jgi:hypothetical protein
MTSRRRLRHAAALIGVLSLAACSDGDEGADVTIAHADSGGPDDEVPDDERYPDVVAAVADRDDASGTWTFQVTMLSPYDTPDRYADGWRIVGPDGTVYGVHTLTHDHADEQPFTRTQRNVEIPAHVDEVTVEGRDLRYGFGGGTVTISVQTG